MKAAAATHYCNRQPCISDKKQLADIETTATVLDPNANVEQFRVLERIAISVKSLYRSDLEAILGALHASDPF